MLEYTKTEPTIGIRAASDNVLHGAVQGTLLVVVRGTDDVLRKVKLPIVLVAPGLKINLFSSSAAAQKYVKTVIAKMSRPSTLNL